MKCQARAHAGPVRSHTNIVGMHGVLYARRVAAEGEITVPSFTDAEEDLLQQASGVLRGGAEEGAEGGAGQGVSIF